ncbi:uncharacterized protein K02A2.6-like [Cydia strobilella]|uniref:uncharacterized protein K02A2.6-like n=1 Tax=Cydia strobilella TaxID=1100964 RepID=UPI0030076F53
MPIGKIEQFDLASKKWLAYIRRVKQFITLNEIKDNLQVATLVTLVGEATYSLMCDLCAPADPETKTFTDLVKIVGDHLEPKRSEIAERHVFRQRRQKAGEPVGEYLQALKHLASTCNFSSGLEENLRDQFVSGLSDDDMRSRLFAEAKLTYKRAVELALALEAAERHAQASSSGSGASAATAGHGAGEALHRVEARGGALRKPVERELERLVAEGTIYKVDYSDFGTPIVPVIKKSGEIRICGDYKVTVNPKLVQDPYPLPRIEELFAALSGGEQYKKFQKFMEETLRGLRGVAVFLDDIAVTGRDRDEHMANLTALFERLRDVGLRIKLEKCSFMQDSIVYVGFIIDKQGLHPDPDKIKAIVEAPAPNDVTQLRSFLGLINYYAKFIPNLSSTLYPLHRLLRKDVPWVWSTDCNKAFLHVKNVVAGRGVLVHYDPDLPLVLAVDSSSYGLGSVLSHRFPDGSERPICFASRTLTAAERAYSQLDKEALAIIAGVIKHHQYLYGRHFIIKTDHKPLTFIFGSKHGLPQTAASRLQRYATRLAAYDFQIEFVKSNDNSNADALSRLPLPCRRNKEKGLDAMSYINYVEESFPISARDVASGTQSDVVLKNIFNYVRDGWPVSVLAEQEKSYFHRKDKLTLDRGCILYNHRVVIPDGLRQQVLMELHEGHLGVVKMKNLARGYVYWPQLDAEIEALCRACAACRQQRDAPPRATLHPWSFPSRPWQRLHVDFGEFQGKHYLVTVDAHSKWIEIQKMPSTNAAATILKLRKQFARFGLPSQIVSDGGPPFASAEFAEYLKKNFITHTITSPYRAAGNGAAENAVKTAKRAMKKALHEGADIDIAICRFLFQYRNTQHCTTGVTPAEALMGRRLRGRLDIILPTFERAERVNRAQDRAGQHRPGAERHVQPGDTVQARDYRRQSGKWAEAIVTERRDPLTYTVRLSDGHEWKRHIDQLLPIQSAKNRYSLSKFEPKSVVNNDDDIVLPSTSNSRPSPTHNDVSEESDEYQDPSEEPPASAPEECQSGAGVRPNPTSKVVPTDPPMSEDLTQ